jgi:hypothetical protein
MFWTFKILPKNKTTAMTRTSDCPWNQNQTYWFKKCWDSKASFFKLVKNLCIQPLWATFLMVNGGKGCTGKGWNKLLNGELIKNQPLTNAHFTNKPSDDKINHQIQFPARSELISSLTSHLLHYLNYTRKQRFS